MVLMNSKNDPKLSFRGKLLLNLVRLILVFRCISAIENLAVEVSQQKNELACLTNQTSN